MKVKLILIGLIGINLVACNHLEKKIYSKEELEASEELQNKVWKDEKCDSLTDLQIANNKNCLTIQDIRWFTNARKIRAPKGK